MHYVLPPFALSKQTSRVGLAPTVASDFKKRTQEPCSIGLRAIQPFTSNERCSVIFGLAFTALASSCLG
jgi:hypothetical protein